MGPKRHIFSKDHIFELLTVISGDPEHFEKPTAQIFYRRICENSHILGMFEWTALRDKMRQQKIKYKTAIDWRNGTGAGLTGEGKEQTVRDYILKLCPNFDSLDIIFGTRPSFHPLFLMDSDVQNDIEVYMENNSGDSQEVSNTQTLEGEDDIDQSPTSPLVQEDERNSSPLSFKEKLKRKPSGGKTGVGTSSVAQLAQMNRERMWIQEKRLDMEKEQGEKRLEMETEQGEKRLELERQQFLWMQEKERRLLELEENKAVQEAMLKTKQIEEESKLKREELLYKFEIEKLKIERGIPL